MINMDRQTTSKAQSTEVVLKIPTTRSPETDHNEESFVEDSDEDSHQNPRINLEDKRFLTVPTIDGIR